jgi:hypothetical protein
MLDFCGFAGSGADLADLLSNALRGMGTVQLTIGKPRFPNCTFRLISNSLVITKANVNEKCGN